MSHNIEYNETTGQYSFFTVKQPAWHNLVKPIDKSLNRHDALLQMQADYRVYKEQLEINGKKIPAWGVFRDDKPIHDGFLSTVKKDYFPIQTEEAMELADQIIGNIDGAHYITGGVLGNGERVWALIELPKVVNIDGVDPHTSHLLVTTSHDGTGALIFKLVMTRVVCANTLTAGLMENGADFRIIHTKNAKKRMQQALAVIQSTFSTIDTVEEKLNTLSHRMLTKEKFIDILNRLFPPKVATDANTGEEVKVTTAQRQNLLTDIILLAEKNDDNFVPEHKGTAYNLFNAITNYSDHLRRVRTTDTDQSLSHRRAEVAMFGQGAAFKQELLEVMLEETVGSELRPYRNYVHRAIDNGEAERAERANRRTLLDDILDGENN